VTRKINKESDICAVTKNNTTSVTFEALFKVVLHKPTKSVNFGVFDGITIFFFYISHSPINS
jgi:hypothetical protein